MTTTPHLEPSDPDELIVDAQWFERGKAIEELSSLPYDPKREPASRFLKSGDHGLHWAFDLDDLDARIPSFHWDPPTIGHPQD